MQFNTSAFFITYPRGQSLQPFTLFVNVKRLFSLFELEDKSEKAEAAIEEDSSSQEASIHELDQYEISQITQTLQDIAGALFSWGVEKKADDIAHHLGFREFWKNSSFMINLAIRGSNQNLGCFVPRKDDQSPQQDDKNNAFDSRFAWFISPHMSALRLTVLLALLRKLATRFSGMLLDV